MKIKDGDFKELVDTLFATQESEFNHIYEQEKIERFKTLCKDKKLIILGTGYYLKVLPKFLKLTYGVDIYGVYDWVAEEQSGEGILVGSEDYKYLDLKKYNKFKANLISKEEFYSDPANTVIFLNSETFPEVPVRLYENGFKDIYHMRCLASGFLTREIFDKKTTGLEMYDINEINHSFTTPEIARIVTLYNLLEDEKSREIFKAMIKFKLTEDYYYTAYSRELSGEQYFDKEIISLKDDEVFVDCGGYNGDTIAEFLEASNGKFKYIYSYEPDDENFKILSEFVSKLPQEIKEKITPIKAGVHHENATFYMQGEGLGATLSAEISEQKIDVAAISDAINHIPTFIKMDVQTFETYALLGAMDDIISHKPKLAVCIYHKFSDLWDIPLLLKLWIPDCELFMRHYECTQEETVIYALPEAK
jgi:methyltransferase, fkbM family